MHFVHVLTISVILEIAFIWMDIKECMPACIKNKGRCGRHRIRPYALSVHTAIYNTPKVGHFLNTGKRKNKGKVGLLPWVLEHFDYFNLYKYGH